MTDTHVILAGQSNALGYLNDGPAPYKPTERVQIWADTDADGVADTWNFMLPGKNTGTLAYPHVWGPEVQFANRWLSSHPTGILWIVKTVKGSTGLAEDGGALDWSPDSTGEMFDLSTTAIAAAKANLAGGQYTFSSYDAALWMQGEQDATDETKANAYGTNLTAFVTAAREHWSVERFIIGRISDGAAYPYGAAVREAQWALPQEDADVTSFKTIGFERHDDNIHYDAVGHVQLGNAFYYAFDGP